MTKSGSRRTRVNRARWRIDPMDLRIVIVALAVVAVDLVAKLWATAVGGQSGAIVRDSNPGLALGVATPPYAVTVALVASLTLVIGTLCRRGVQRGELEPWVAGTLVGGASANLLDRLVSGSVHDFLRVGSFALNLADVMFLIGFAGVFATVVRARVIRRATGELNARRAAMRSDLTPR